jgi:D-beta-D-heptose 7-phosphate kinase/D-beta-D-heptose 1-phosphate adenosyltransferase
VQHCAAPDVSDVFDTVGAGDTSIAVLTLALSAGVPAADAVMLANYASGIVVRHVGNYAPTPDELAQSILDGGL